MKKFKIIKIIICFIMIFFITSCSIKKDDLEGAKIYTTVYPIKYLTDYLYNEHGEINSIYPVDADITTYKFSKKSLKEFANSDLFIYNGWTNEKDLAKDLINKNKKLLIIDASKDAPYESNIAQLWLSPKNYLKLAKNIKSNLQEYLTSKYIVEEIENKYKEFEENISLLGASLYAQGNESAKNGKNIIITSSNLFNYLKDYGFEIISLENEANLKDNKLNTIKNNFKSGKYKYILTADFDSENELILDLTKNYNAQAIAVNTLTSNNDIDYFEVMTNYIENIKTITQ